MLIRVLRYDIISTVIPGGPLQRSCNHSAECSPSGHLGAWANTQLSNYLANPIRVMFEFPSWLSFHRMIVPRLIHQIGKIRTCFHINMAADASTAGPSHFAAVTDGVSGAQYPGRCWKRNLAAREGGRRIAFGTARLDILGIRPEERRHEGWIDVQSKKQILQETT